jgi:PTH1 family peptidyl-tRNA hydrolase
MNKSGESVAALVQFYKIELDRLLVVYDDLDIHQGTIRFRPSGGTGGHRGMNSIVQRLGSRDFPRLRVGIGRPPGRMDPADYVLQNFSPREKPDIEDALNRAVAAIEAWLMHGVEATMNHFN